MERCTDHQEKYPLEEEEQNRNLEEFHLSEGSSIVLNYFNTTNTTNLLSERWITQGITVTRSQVSATILMYIDDLVPLYYSL